MLGLLIVLLLVGGGVIAFLFVQGKLPGIPGITSSSSAEDQSEQSKLSSSRLRHGSVVPSAYTGYMKDLVDLLERTGWWSVENSTAYLSRAGYRGTNTVLVLLLCRLVSPFAFLIFSSMWMLFIFPVESSLKMTLIIVGATGFGAYFPDLVIINMINKRQSSIRSSWPDALDLLLIGVEAGMSLEASLQRVVQDVREGPLAEELSIMLAELSFLQERRKAYDNLAARTGLPAIRNVCLALAQAERYGTPIGQALRVLSKESRAERMALAEQKAAALPPKLTVPMIVFFLPVLFMIILGPALIVLILDL